MKHKNKILSAILSLLLIIGTIPSATYADVYDPVTNAAPGNYTISSVGGIFEITSGTIILNNGDLIRSVFMGGLTVAGGTSYKLVSSENYVKFQNSELTFDALPDKGANDLVVNNDIIIAYIPENSAFPTVPDASNVAIYKIKTTTSTHIINNGKLRFGDGSEDSINDKGGLEQPFYFNQSWKQLTYSDYPLNYGIGINGTAPLLDNSLSNIVYNYSGLSSGSGVVTATGELTVDGKLLEITNRYELGAAFSFIKITTTVKNKSDSEITDVKYWAGTQDDYVGGTDSPSKIKGNLVDGVFVDLTAMDQQAKALKIYTGSEGVLFFSTNPNTDMILYSDLDFNGLVGVDPRASVYSMSGDDSYGMRIALGNIAAGATASFDWYYAAGSIADIGTITENLDQEANVPSNDATLSALSPSTGTLSPAFASGTTAYSFTVPTDVSSLTLTATKNNSAATLTLNGQAITSGAASQSVALSYGSNTLTVVVTAEDGTTTTTYTVTVTRTAPASEPNTEPATEPATEKTTEAVMIIVNGVAQNAGTEEKTTEGSKTVVKVQVNSSLIDSKIESTLQSNPTGNRNLIQIPVSDTTSEITKVELTGDIIKKLETNTFDISIKKNNIEYIVPASEFTIGNVASQLGVSEASLIDIKIEVRITSLDASITDQYKSMTKESGAEIIFAPVSFEIVAKTTKSDGTTGEVLIDTFTNYVERIMEIPADVDPSKITTGIVFNPDGTFSHVPTNVYEENGKWYAKLNSLTNSDYSVVWHPVVIASVDAHWSKVSVNDMASRLVIINKDTFDPNHAITRGMFAEYLVRALGLYRDNASVTATFSDVSATHKDAIAIYTALNYNLISGYADGTFKPDEMITREEAFAILSRAMSITNLQDHMALDTSMFTDLSDASKWALPSINTLLSTHVVHGKSSNQLDPLADLTAAEAIAAIRNLLVEAKLINE